MASKKPKNATKARKSRLSANQLKAAGMLANGDRYIVVAERLDIDAETLRRWRQSTAFKAKVADLQLVQAEEIQFSLKANGRAVSENLRLAIATCKSIMENPEAKDSDRISAARTAFDMALRLLPNVEPPDTIEAADTEAEPDFTPEKLQRVRENIYGIY